MTTSHCRFLSASKPAVAIADQLFQTSSGNSPGCVFAAVECRHFMTAIERVPHLIWPGKSGAAKNEDARRFHGLYCEQ